MFLGLHVQIIHPYNLMMKSIQPQIISLSKQKDKFVLSKLSPPPIHIYEYQNYWAGRHLLSIVVNEVEHIHSEIQFA